MRGLRTALATTAGVMALVVPAGATAQIRSISVGDGQLGPQGASVTLPVTVQCDPGWNLAFANVTVAQSIGHKLAQGSGTMFENFPGVPCDQGTTFTITVNPSGTQAFKQGDAAATADVEVFNPSDFQFVEQRVTQAIRITKKPSPYADPLSGRRSSHRESNRCSRNVCRR